MVPLQTVIVAIQSGIMVTAHIIIPQTQERITAVIQIIIQTIIVAIVIATIIITITLIQTVTVITPAIIITPAEVMAEVLAEEAEVVVIPVVADLADVTDNG